MKTANHRRGFLLRMNISQREEEHYITPDFWSIPDDGHIDLFYVPASAPRMGLTKTVICTILSVVWCI